MKEQRPADGVSSPWRHGPAGAAPLVQTAAAAGRRARGQPEEAAAAAALLCGLIVRVAA